MSSIGPSDVPLSSLSTSKHKKHKKKRPGAKVKVNVNTEKTNGNKNDAEDGPDEEDPDEPETPAEDARPQSLSEETQQNGMRSPAVNGTYHKVMEHPLDRPVLEAVNTPPRSPTHNRSRKTTIGTEPQREVAQADDQGDTGARLDALVKERETLRNEVAELRKSLEEIQVKHTSELGNTQKELEDTEGERDRAETKYRDLLGKVNTIKSQLGERLKADAEDLSQARSRIEDLEEQNTNLHEQNASREAELAKLAEDGEQRSKELSSLRNRLNLSQQNWTKEREGLLQREQYAKEEFESARQAMQDWEVLAMEERSIRENLAERVADLEDQVSTHREAYEKAAAERDSQSLTVDGLQRALQEIQQARKQELREMVENSQAQVEDLRAQLQEAKSKSTESTAALESAERELERALPFELEVKEKNLLIGKLRHEAVILNDHLTKALRHLKKGKPDDNIDK
ncbi:hypothetical protein MMC30_001610 [Trapelia coarctata]|nr:hypothetical protein [Trapelia coarctata]